MMTLKASLMTLANLKELVMHEFAEVLALCGDLPTRLVSLHGDDGTGRCARCSSGAQTVRYTHPCTIRSAATRALLIQASALSGMVLEQPRPQPASGRTS